MQFWNEYIAGVESIWCLLAASVFAFVLVTAKLIGAWSSQRLVHVAQDEAGATYMLPLVLMLPFYVLLIAMIIECTLILTTKIGCVGAAYSAARSAAVWLPYENAMPSDAPDYTPLEDRQAMVRQAVARAMWAYASGAKAHATDAAMDEFLNATINQQIAVFQAYSGNQKYDADYLKRKFAYAYNSSTVEIVYFDPENDKSYAPDETPVFNAKIQLTLRYEAPFHTAGIGRLFGERSQFGSHFVFPVATTVVIENEGVKGTSFRHSKIRKSEKSPSIGINYYDRLYDDSSSVGTSRQADVVEPIFDNQAVPERKPTRPSSGGLFGGIKGGVRNATQIDFLIRHFEEFSSGIPSGASPGLESFSNAAIKVDRVATILEIIMGAMDAKSLYEAGQNRDAMIRLGEAIGSSLGGSLGATGLTALSLVSLSPPVVLVAGVIGGVTGSYVGEEAASWIAAGIADTLGITNKIPQTEAVIVEKH